MGRFSKTIRKSPRGVFLSNPSETLAFLIPPFLLALVNRVCTVAPSSGGSRRAEEYPLATREDDDDTERNEAGRARRRCPRQRQPPRLACRAPADTARKYKSESELAPPTPLSPRWPLPPPPPASPSAGSGSGSASTRRRLAAAPLLQDMAARFGPLLLVLPLSSALLVLSAATAPRGRPSQGMGGLWIVHDRVRARDLLLLLLLLRWPPCCSGCGEAAEGGAVGEKPRARDAQVVARRWPVLAVSMGRVLLPMEGRQPLRCQAVSSLNPSFSLSRSRPSIGAIHSALMRIYLVVPLNLLYMQVWIWVELQLMWYILMSLQELFFKETAGADSRRDW